MPSSSLGPNANYTAVFSDFQLKYANTCAASASALTALSVQPPHSLQSFKHYTHSGSRSDAPLGSFKFEVLGFRFFIYTKFKGRYYKYHPPTQGFHNLDSSLKSPHLLEMKNKECTHQFQVQLFHQNPTKQELNV